MFDSLNPAQRRAVAHGDGPLLVIAGAGSGKTLTLACRVASLLERGVPPQRMLLLTFSRRAAREMLARAERIRGDGAAGRVWGGTFHAVANRLLRLSGRPLGLRPDFTVLDQADAADTMNLLRNELGYGTAERRFPRKDTLAAIYSRTVNAEAKLARVVRDNYPWCGDELEGMKAVFSAYTARKREANVLDYDDLLLFWRALAGSPEAGSSLAASFDHILVDEYQDTNRLQADILRAMRPPGSSLTVVGDDAQAIYGFRAATVRNILEFSQQFPGTTIERLEQNYRSTQPILAASNAVIALSPQRHAKTLWSDRAGDVRPVLRTCLDEAEQSEAVCAAVLDRRERGTPLKRQAVLFRAGHHSDLLEVELARRNVPFVKYGGLKFLEAAHVKDLLALLRVLENPRDEIAWFRVLLLLDGVGPATAARLMDALGVRTTDGSALRRLVDDPPPIPIGAQRGYDELRRALADCAPGRLGADRATAARGGDGAPAVEIQRLRGFVEPVFRRTYDDAEARLRDIDQLEQLAAGYADRATFLAELTLDPPSSTSELAGAPLLDEDWLVLSTIHSAKGLEWDAVHVIHAADGMIPSDMATGDEEEIEEERRLLYVAMTRARDELFIHFPQRYYRRPRGLEDRHALAQLSRFLSPDVRSAFREVAPSSTPEPAAAGAVIQQRGAAPVDALLADLWD
jgi:DNA helicase II / ATP-dependent DNA helicase PcrA